MQTNTPPAPAWTRGPIVLAGNWEPLIFRRRVGGGAADAAEQYAREHTPELVERLIENGVNLLITHYFKGFGLQAEAEDMDWADRLIALCHDRGVRVGGYVGDTFIFETLLNEEPAAADWAQQDPDGKPLNFGGTQTFRWKWCRNNPAFLPYMQKVLARGVARGLDLIHFDNFLNKPEPVTCRCPHCAAQFRAFLEEKYDEAQRRERFGFAGLGELRPPTFSSPLYTAYSAEVIRDPLLQEWVDFRCHTLTRSYAALSAFVRKLNPEVAIECNPTGIWGENSAYMRSVDHARLLPHGQFFWDESPNPHGLQPNGALPTTVRSMKLGEATGNRIFTYVFGQNEEEAAVLMAEALAFNRGCLGMVSFLQGDSVPAAPRCRPYAEFLHEHAGLFCNTTSLARIGVFRHSPSLAYNSWEPHLQAILAEQTLLQHHIPFDLCFDLDTLPWPILILPGTECLSTDEVESCLRFAEQGGHLILIDAPGSYDNWRRTRPAWPFADCFAADESRAECGQGMLLRVPALQLPAGAPSREERAVWDDFYAVVDGRFWLVPENDDVLLDALTTNGEAAQPYRVDAPATTLIEPRLLADGAGLVIHIVNYDAAVRGREVRIRMPQGMSQAQAAWLAPGRATQMLEVERDGEVAAIALPLEGAYSLIHLAGCPS